MRRNFTIQELCSGILVDNRAILSQAITLAESTLESHHKIISQVLETIANKTGNSLRIGITGVPGVGKSTLIESLGLYLIKQGKKVAVLAVDPTSSVSKGSILGDKTRMEELAKEKNAFIRPTPAGEKLGGVAKSTFETIALCEAAGFDIIIIETVGVGQSETLVYEMTDLFLLMQLPNSGDELQGIKRGIMERADLIFINKAEQDNQSFAKQMKINLTTAIQFLPKKENHWKTKILQGSALENKGIKELWKMMEQYFLFVNENDSFQQKREKQLLFHCENYLKNLFFQQLQSMDKYKTQQEEILAKIKNNKIIPYLQINQLIKQFF